MTAARCWHLRRDPHATHYPKSLCDTTALVLPCIPYVHRRSHQVVTVPFVFHFACCVHVSEAQSQKQLSHEDTSAPIAIDQKNEKDFNIGSSCPHHCTTSNVENCLLKCCQLHGFAQYLEVFFCRASCSHVRVGAGRATHFVKEKQVIRRAGTSNDMFPITS